MSLNEDRDKVTSIEQESEKKPVIIIEEDSDGNLVAKADLNQIKLDIDSIIDLEILSRYNSMFGSLLIAKDKGTFSPYEQAFYELFIYALALKTKLEELQ